MGVADSEKDIFTTNADGRIRKQEKNPKFDNVYFKWGLTIFLTFLCCILSIYFVFFNADFRGTIRWINHILSPVYVGLIIAYLFSPFLNILEQKIMQPLFKRIKFLKKQAQIDLARAASIVILIIISIILIYSIIQLAVKQIFPSIVNIIKNLGNYANNLTRWADKVLEDNPTLNAYVTGDLNRYSNDIIEWVTDNYKNLTGNFIRSLSQGFLSFLLTLWNFVIGFIISIYVLWSKESHVARAKKLTYAIFSRETANAIVEGFRQTHRTFIGFFFGKIVDSIIIGLLCYIGCTIMQIPNTLLISIIIGVTNIIPFFGPYFGGIPSAILIFAYDPMHPMPAVAFAIFIVCLQQFDGNILGPRILSTSTGLTGFWVIFSITLFGGLFGLLGMVIGVPVFAVIYAGVKQFSRIRLKQKGYPYHTKDYLEVGTIAEDGSVIPIPPDEKHTNNKSFVVDSIKKIKEKKNTKKDKS